MKKVMAKTAWLVLVIVALGIALLTTDVEAGKENRGRRPFRRPLRVNGPQRRGPKPPLCMVTSDDGSIPWSLACPEDAPCNITLPGPAPFTVNGNDVTTTACDIDDYKPLRAPPCMLRYLNGTVITSRDCSDGAACNVSRGIIPLRRSGEAAEGLLCDQEKSSERTGERTLPTNRQHRRRGRVPPQFTRRESGEMRRHRRERSRSSNGDSNSDSNSNSLPDSTTSAPII